MYRRRMELASIRDPTIEAKEEKLSRHTDYLLPIGIILTSWALSGCNWIFDSGDPVHAQCGDGIVHPSNDEECDDRGESATCNSNCTLAQCGDGIVNIAADEQCDDADESVYCNADCTIAFCGDGKTKRQRKRAMRHRRELAGVRRGLHSARVW